MKKNKNIKTLNKFIRYCKENPEERFWQALRNWSGYLKIYGEYENKEVDDVVVEDTFYLED